MQNLLLPILKFLAQAFGFTAQALKENERVKGLEAHNAIMQAEIERDENKFDKTVKINEEKIPSFNYDNIFNN